MKYLLSSVFLLVSCMLSAQVQYKTTAFSVVIKGTSNVHAWQSKTSDGRAIADIEVDASGKILVKSLKLDIPARSIKSEKGSIMDNKTYDALKADKNPHITLNLTQPVTIGGSASASCELNIAGSSHTTDLKVDAQVATDGSVKFSGRKNLKMTDFGIKPPTAMMGMMTTGNNIEIIFSLTVKKS